jgi:hypothetical protein
VKGDFNEQEHREIQQAVFGLQSRYYLQQA